MNELFNTYLLVKFKYFFYALGGAVASFAFYTPVVKRGRLSAIFISLINLCLGTFAGVVFGGGVVDHYKLDGQVAGAVFVVFGFVGLVLLSTIYKVAESLQSHSHLIIEKIIKK